VNPHCGHACEVPCFRAVQLQAMTKNKPVETLDEGAIPSVPESVGDLRCKKEVLVRRACGHELRIACSMASAALPRCSEKCSLRSPLCGHAIAVPCHAVASLSAWQPWDEPTLGSLTESQLLPAGAKPQGTGLLPDHTLAHLNACRRSVRVVKPCGHTASYDCKQLLKIVGDGEVKGRCSEAVTARLRCGHMASTTCQKYQDYLEERATITCKDTTLRHCWNSSVCGCTALATPCASSSTAAFCCDSVRPWNCPAGRHTFNMKLCSEGAPTACPSCSEDDLDAAIEALAAEVDPLPLDNFLPGCFVKTIHREQVQELEIAQVVTRKFCEAKGILLQRFKACLAQTPLWDRQLFAPMLFPCFYVLEDKAQRRQGFVPMHDFVKAKTLNGVQVYRLTPANLQALAAGRAGPVQLLVGFAFSVKASAAASWPTKKQEKQASKTWREHGFDCAEFDSRSSMSPLVIWNPFALYATHRVTVTQRDLELATALLARLPTPGLGPSFAVRARPPGNELVVCAAAAGAGAGAEAACTGQIGALSVDELCGTWAQALAFQQRWDGSSLASGDALSAAQERELMQKLSFINRDAAPFAGKNVLESIAKANRAPVLDLLAALELQPRDADRAKAHLDAYLACLQEQPAVPAHPLGLLALQRVAGLRHALPAFARLYPLAAELLLLPAERASLQGQEPEADGATGPGGAAAVGGAAAADPKEVWEELKETQGCASDAMDKLVDLTGLKKVKVTAVALFKSALQFRRMNPEARKANALSLNYCFLGNPGTGKTTVARLFAEVLHDSGMRTKKTFTECTAQKLKDAGADEFRKQAKGALDGVLFIDEAYDLDPVGDKFKGAPIVNELLTLAENERDRLTVILAGYEDDMNSKMYAYNDGLKSRFQEVIFEDFDEGELMRIWTDMREQRKWTEADPRLTSVLIRRLLKSAGRKGFGNAREVRKRLEQAAASAMSRPDFDPESMTLNIADVVGEDPRNNPKLRKMLDEINEKTGWSRIKKAVADLVTVCGANYHRELDGQAPLPVFMNRMFLGNPGTGKTTCAKLYGQVLKHLGFLSLGDVVFKTAGDLGGSVVGEAKQKTLDVVKGAAGKILVIDEAYNLDDSLYGKQALDTLVEKVQGSENDDIAVLLLGYEAEMLAMLRNQNPGLARRFPPEQAFWFEDYTDAELLEILTSSCQRKGVKASVEFQEKALRKLGMLRRSETNFGNAGAVNNLLQAALLKASSRAGVGDGSVKLEACDVDIGPEDEASGDPFAPLDRLYRMEGIRHKLQQLSNAFSVAQREGSEIPELGHFVFTGSPGTGKTTVARVMAKILFDLRLLGKNHVQETSGLNLTGEYVGQTKKKVEEQLDAAKGGVLFIDEAYELGKGPFGAEACTAIVAAMTDPKYAGLVIAIAGYQADISDMLDTNPGLKSRFTHFFEFPDWTAADCVSLFVKRASAQNYALAPAAAAALAEGLEQLLSLDGWGNARDVDKLWKASLQHRADRVCAAPETEKTLAEADVQPAVGAMLAARRGTPAGRRIPKQGAHLPMQARSAEPPAYHHEAADTRDADAEAGVEEGPQGEADAVNAPGHGGRDAGVSDEVWAELQQAKADAEAREAQLQRELEEQMREEERRVQELQKQLEDELERVRREMEAAEEQQRLEAERRARAEHEARVERERLAAEARRRELERLQAEKRREQAIQEKLRQISPCPAGFQWFKTGGGWRCGGGSHFVSDAQLKSQFTF